MKKIEMVRILLAAGLGIGLGCVAAVGQEAGQDVKDAGHANQRLPAVDTGHATKDAAKDTAHVTKKVGA